MTGNGLSECLAAIGDQSRDYSWLVQQVRGQLGDREQVFTLVPVHLQGRDCLLVGTAERVFVSGTSWSAPPALVGVNAEANEVIVGTPSKHVVLTYQEQEREQLLAGLRAARDAGRERRKLRNRRIRGVVVLCGILACVGFMLHYLGGGNGDGSPVDRSPAAVRFCQQKIKTQLKDPASAKFENHVQMSDDSVYTIASTVRAKNGFGGVVPAYFVCQAKWDDTRSEFSLWDFSRTG